MRAAQKVAASVSVYDGRRHIGELVVLLMGQFEAQDADGQRLGLFDDLESARRALVPLVRSEADHG